MVWGIRGVELPPPSGNLVLFSFYFSDHTNLEERLHAARQLQSAQPACSIVIDTMSDGANFQYGGLYERLYVVLNGTIVYQGERGPGGYKIEEVQDWLNAYRRSKQV